MDREAMLATIDALYQERIAGLTDTMATHLAEGATFRMAGEGQMDVFGSDGAVGFLDALRTLNGGISMTKVTIVEAVAEGNRCVVCLTADVGFGDRAPFETEIFNLWSFDEAGKVTSLTEFVDTAKLVSEVQMLSGSLV